MFEITPPCGYLQTGPPHNLSKSRLRVRTLLAVTLLVILAAPVRAQIVDSGQINEEIERTDDRILSWATGVVDFERGWVNYLDEKAGRVSFGDPKDPLGPNGEPFSLGDGGWITFSFLEPVGDGDGIDLAVFENGFESGGGVYMELGFVEVSSNGTDFVRLPNLARRETQPGAFEGSFSEDFYNLAGNFVGGTGIDLGDLLIDPDPLVIDGTVDLGNIQFVRVRDVIGDIAGPGTTFDSHGRAVADPFPTPFASGGMDITGVALLNPPVPSGIQDDIASSTGSNSARTMVAYPNPFADSVRLDLDSRSIRTVEILDARGRRVAALAAAANRPYVDWDGRNSHGQELPRGVYFVRGRDEQAVYTATIRKVR